jgi:rhodanese-related sulfurtransferase
MSTETTSGVQTITPRELQRRRDAGELVELIDVRTPAEYREVHADIARLVPLDRLDPKGIVAARAEAGDAPLYVICRSGSRGQKAAETFLAAGFPNVINVEGGTLAWDQAGLPVVRGKKAIALERQVRTSWSSSGRCWGRWSARGCWSSPASSARG